MHWSQLGIIGAMGMELLDWLRERTLPEEARVADVTYARATARDFLRLLAASGTTTALVFGSHFQDAQHAFLEEAARSGLRIASGLVVSDRYLLPEFHYTPDAAYDAGRELARRWHGQGHLRYAVSPRFSISCSEDMLEACGALGGELDGALVTSHLNENRDEVRAVADWFPWADHYLETYEQHGLVGRRTVLAHDVHPDDAELERLATARAASPTARRQRLPRQRDLPDAPPPRPRRALRTRHRRRRGHRPRHAEGGPARLPGADGRVQRVRLSPAHLLWLATRAGARIARPRRCGR